MQIPQLRAWIDLCQEGKSSTDAGDDDLTDDDDLDDEDAEGPKKPLQTTFELNDTLYAEAELEDTDTVYLWLGVRTLLRYDTFNAPDAYISAIGKCDALVQNPSSHLVARVKTRGCRGELADRSGGSRVPEGTDHYYGSEYRSRIQLGCEAEART